MWGKSTFLRQNAIILLLSHCWLFVPAEKVETSILDWIFARVWSWDVIAKNQSTFLTEMLEVSNILNNANENSFIILDELWRWTSTYDWVAIAKAIIQFLSEKIKAKTLFATHYHELIKLEEKYRNIKNYSVWVFENKNEIVFLKKIIEWWASKSYWIDVAKIAWLPNEIILNSRQYLKKLEDNKTIIKATPLFENDYEKDIENQKDLEKMNNLKNKYYKIENIINQIEINNTTPLKALEIINKIKEEISL